ncbi:hypothetical protein FIBSPDRAFT_1040435 [Athelia psychrophila]|uniref:Uncharacterized protein n=1 Tax=Athelia psychrophila TaxID=1759441 RepID=A0A166QAN3_9AGAM|nr:hypothetical protein FIBSPDRAFT_1040435 [Fibularhizoctonia sp. CBS 109695]
MALPTTPPAPRITSTLKRHRRTATAVLAGEFDPRPKRFVLTALLNGVPANQSLEAEERTKREKKREKRDRDREMKKEKAAAAREAKDKDSAVQAEASSSSVTTVAPTKTSISAPPAQTLPVASSFWRARPAIHIASMQRSISVTPPPMPSSPVSTPGPSMSSSTSRTSSKRPFTPDDDDELHTVSAPARPREPPRKRAATKKGWKGWVEGSPPPSEKLINLDYAPVLRERKTRSGKAFDAIGQGKEDWI